MKKILSLCLLLLATGSRCPATISIVNHTFKQGAGASGTTPAIDTTGADAIFMWVSSTSCITITITDSKSNPWLPALRAFVTSGGVSGCFTWIILPTVGAGHTFTVAGSSEFISFEVLATKGSQGGPAFITTGTGGVTSTSAASITPTSNNAMILSGVCTSTQPTGATFAVDSGFTISDQSAFVGSTSYAGAIGYLIETTATAKTPVWSWTGSASASMAINTVVYASSGGGGVVGLIARDNFPAQPQLFLQHNNFIWMRKEQYEDLFRRTP